MVEQVLLALQALFLLLLYLFVWRVIRSAARSLRSPEESFVLPPQETRSGHRDPQAAQRPPARLVTVSSTTLSPGTAVEVGPVPITIGRADDNLLPLPVDEFASARHARVEALRDGVWVVDLDSTNGTLVNGTRIAGRKRLGDGDVVQVGDTELRFES